MLTTSVSLPKRYARIWRRRKRRIMRQALRAFRIELRKNPVKRGVTRKYNRPGEDMAIVTTRFTRDEYDALHYVAASVRVSVSLLVFLIIRMWLKPARRRRPQVLASRHELDLHCWNQHAGVITESLLILSSALRPEMTLHPDS